MWWHRIFFGILDQTVVNAQIVYSKLEEKVVSVLNYRRTVAAQALITRATPAKVGRPNLSPGTSAPAKLGKVAIQFRKMSDYRIGELTG